MRAHKQRLNTLSMQLTEENKKARVPHNRIYPDSPVRETASISGSQRYRSDSEPRWFRCIVLLLCCTGL